MAKLAILILSFIVLCLIAQWQEKFEEHKLHEMITKLCSATHRVINQGN